MKSVGLLSLLGVAAGAKPEMPTQYTARVTMTMPYYEFVEPIDGNSNACVVPRNE